MALVVFVQQKDSLFGMVKETILLYGNGMDASGKIYVCEEGLVIKDKGETIRAPFEYVKMIAKVGELPLGKVAVEAEVYDQMGNRFSLALNMADGHFGLLRGLCPKA